MKRRETILIFHIGSLGDTTIAIPTYREIAQRHPDAHRVLLTNFPIGAKMVPMSSLLQPMGLIEESISFPMHLRKIRDMRDLRRQLSQFNPKILYYLTPEKRRFAMIRHCAFFVACGITSFKGIPWSADLREPREVVEGLMWETEGSRLLRTIGAKNDTKTPPQSERDLNLSQQEIETANSLLTEAQMPIRFLTISVGGKVPINDWGDQNWSQLLASLSHSHPDLGLVCVGSRDERKRNDELLKHWRGPHLNSCGLLSPRETGALLKRATLFVGHDTATLHLAVASGIRVIGIYSARNVPGKWFSGRPNDITLYQQVPCFGCLHEKIEDCPNDLVCMKSHNPALILDKIEHALDESLISVASHQMA